MTEEIKDREVAENTQASGETEGKTPFRSGFVTMIGLPNVGKSTLMNALVGQKLAITSNKAQTTRNAIRTIRTDDRGQIIFVDTPGIHHAKNRLGEYMMEEVRRTLGNVDLILWLVEPSMKISEEDKKIAGALGKQEIPVVLVINKTDRISHDALLPVLSVWGALEGIREIVPVSAMRKKGLGDLVNTIYRYLPEGPALYDPEMVTDQTERQIVSEIIREKALYVLNDEIPHGIAVSVNAMHPRKGKHIMDIDATIYCERESHKGIIIGKKGAMLKRIGTDARYEIEKMIGMHADLKLLVKVKKNWRDSSAELKNFGYQETNE